MSQPDTLERPVVTITEQAATVIKSACEEQSAKLVRFSVALQGDSVVHGITLEMAAAPEDVLFEQHDLTLAVNREQVPLLQGTEIDYRGDTPDGHFVVANPNLQTKPE